MLRVFEVSHDGPFNLKATFECGQTFRWKRSRFPQEQGLVQDLCEEAEHTGYKGVIGPLGVLLWCGNETESSSRLWVGCDPSETSEPLDRVEKRVSHYLSLDDDIESIEAELCRKDPVVMKEAVEFGHGLRILRQDPWECLASFIISIHNNIPAITRTVEYLSRTMGTPVGLGEYSFPSPEVMLSYGIECLKASKCGFRAPYLLDAARKVVSGEVDLLLPKHASLERARQELMKIKGVGPKVCDCVLLFAYHRLEVFPVDTWVAKAMSYFYFARKNISREKARQEGLRRFGDLAGYAQEYLYYYIRTLSRKKF